MNEEGLGKLVCVVTPYYREADTSLLLDCMTVLAKPGHMVTLPIRKVDSSPPLDWYYSNVEWNLSCLPICSMSENQYIRHGQEMDSGN